MSTETTPHNRQPKGTPTGGQFAASAHAESGVSLTSSSEQPAPAAHPVAAQIAATVAPCPDCGVPMTGHLGDGKFLPGSQCETDGCGHTAADMVHETKVDEDGRTFEYRLEPDGTIRVTDDDGDTTHLVRVEEDDWDDVNPFDDVTQGAVVAALASRDAYGLTESACAEAGYAPMSGVYDILLDREAVPTGYLLAHQMTPEAIEGFFDGYISERVDRLASDYTAMGHGSLAANRPADDGDMESVRLACDDAGLMAMWPIYESLADRECLSSYAAASITPGVVENDYATRIAPGIDDIESVTKADLAEFEATLGAA